MMSLEYVPAEQSPESDLSILFIGIEASISFSERGLLRNDEKKNAVSNIQYNMR